MILPIFLLAACSYTVTSPAPGLDGLDPALVCNDQLTTSVTVSGSALSAVTVDGLASDGPDVRLPDLALIRVGDVTGGDADSFDLDLDEEGGGVQWASQSQMSFDVTPGLGLEPGLYDVSVGNLDAQEGDTAPTVLSAGFVSVPAPTVTALDEQILCVEDHAVTLTLTGTTFLSVDGALPTVQFGATSFPADSVSDCTDLAGPTTGQVCTTATVTVPVGGLATGVYDVTLTNPDPAGCVSTEAIQVEVVPPPTLTSVVPDLVCTEQYDNTFTVTGEDFLFLDDGRSPTVQFGSYIADAGSPDGCTSLTGPVAGESCTGLTFDVPQDAVGAGLVDVTITNPEPADCVSLAQAVDVVPAPAVTELVPAGICTDAGDVVIDVTGSGFVELADGTLPTATVGGSAMTVTGTDACTQVSGPSGAFTCDVVQVEVPEGTFTTAGETFAVEITNPEPAQCVSNDDIELEITPTPTLTSIVPTPICSSDTSFDVTGTHLQSGGTVLLDGDDSNVDSVTAANDGLSGTVNLGTPLPGGFYDVEWVNPDTCSATLPTQLEVVQGPILFFVDPPVVWDGMVTEQNLYVGGVTGDITSVTYTEDSTGTAHVIDPDDWSYDGDNILTVTLDAVGLTLPEDEYTIVLEDDSGCVSFLDSAVTVESDLDLAVTEIVEEFAEALTFTAVDIRAKATGDLTGTEVNFADLPRVYLSPLAGGTARPLRSLTFQDETFLSAVIPDDLPAGGYDVIVVNPPPGNEIGVLFADLDPTANDGLLVSTDPPPQVDSIAPNRADQSNDTPVTLQGSDFRNPTVEVECQDAAGNDLPTDDCPVTASDSGSITCTMPSSAYSEGTVCVLRVVNDDLTSTEYSALSIGSPSGNLFDWYPGLAMNTARRSPAAVAGRATERSRYLYAIGGDDGTEANAYDTIEVSPLDVFGDQQTWYDLDAYPLPAPRTLAGVAQVGRFVYLVGGHDGTGPVDTVWRSQILDPIDVPRFDSLGIAFGNGAGLDGGTYSYRIAAIYGNNDPVNPGGEGLPGDPIVVRLPDVPDKVHLNISWTAVDPIDNNEPLQGYAIYRSPVAGSGSGTEEYLTTVSGTSFTDDGSLSTDANTIPLPPGQLGVWHEVATLPGTDIADAAREGACVAVGTDPLDGTMKYLYVGGGRDGNGVIRDTIHYIDIDTDTGDQAVGGFSQTSDLMTPGRWQCGAFALDQTFHTAPAVDETWIYFGPGRIDAGWTDAFEAGLVNSAGDLGSWETDVNAGPDKAGYTLLAANNFVYVIGGSTKGGGGNGTNSGNETALSGTLPILDNWSNLGSSVLTESRDLPGTAIESAIVFSVGGSDTSGNALSTVDYTNF